MNMTRKTFISSAVAATVVPNLFGGAKRDQLQRLGVGRKRFQKRWVLSQGWG